MNYPLKAVDQADIKATIENMNQRKIDLGRYNYLGYNEKMFNIFVKKFLEKRFEKKSFFEK